MCFLRLKDGTIYKFPEHPTLSIEDILSSSKRQVYYDKQVIYDKTNKIRCEITYNPKYNQGKSGTAYRWTVGWIPGMNSLG